MKQKEVPLSPWGPDDEIGAANLIDAGVMMRALQQVKAARFFDLTLLTSPRSPRLAVQSPYSLCMWSHPLVSRHAFAKMGATNGVGFADERAELDLHTGTHIDSLGHCCSGDLMFNRMPVLEVAGNFGLMKLGIEKLPPIITRGVLIDVAAFRGRELNPGEEITEADIKQTLEWEGVTLQPGALVLIRTGWERYYMTDNARYIGPAPGPGVEAADWLARQQVVAVGSDTMVLEVMPLDAAKMDYPVHQHLLANSGVYILENAKLSEISEQRVYDFCCFCLAPRFEGATGIPIRLLAAV